MSYSLEFKDIIRIIGRGRKLQRDLTYDEAYQAMRLVLSGELSEAQIGAFMITMRVKEETLEEIQGFLAAVREKIRPMPQPNVDNLLDIALPYDGKAKYLQTDVPACLILADLGVPVILHGADDIPTKSGVGVLNLLRELGYPVDQSPDLVTSSIEQTNFGVLNLEHVLPEWTAITPIRHHFGLRTLMNTIEKLFHPLEAPNHLSGFYHGGYLQRLAPALPAASHNWIIQGEEGGIGVRPGKKSQLYQADGDQMIKTIIDATEYGFDEIIDIEAPNDVAYHAEQIHTILSGKPHPARDQVVLTSAVVLWLLNVVPDVSSGVDAVRQVLADGHLINRLTPMIS